MKNCDTFIRHPFLRVVAAAESCSADFLRQMLLSIAKRFCIPVSQASKRTQARRTQNVKEDSASRRGVAIIRAAPLLKAGAISRSAQYIC